MFTTQDWEWFIYTTYISGEIRDGLWHCFTNIRGFPREKTSAANPGEKKSQSQSAGYTDGGAPLASD